MPLKCLFECGGLAERLKPLSDLIPKALIEVEGRSIISRWLEAFIDIDPVEVIVACPYDKTHFYAGFCKIYSTTYQIKLSPEERPLGSLGTLREHWTGKHDFFVVPCDAYTDLKVEEFVEHARDFLEPVVCVHEAKKHSHGGVLDVKPSGRVLSVNETDEPELGATLSSGIYYLPHWAEIPRDGTDIAKDLLPLGAFYVYPHQGFHFDIGTFKGLAAAHLFRAF